ncbi:6-phosphogluconolactonase [Marinobacter persicus]|uniref:6-phosphogluconolactonase n=1 Tax=Marinobacter persicus TaxID=930118 RepID=A0A1I3TJT1_9GAMM|nr:6-phosphogluconolactonase [Marinobacter persicus]GHD46417.1 6-phosphogluconolactonase [Marinobacter persicus]SFJ70812.1 6-phosphogluconolactonase [Marinobacter persicus]
MKKPELKLPEGVSFLPATNAREAANALAEEVAAVLSSRLALAGTASLVVSGGTTPVPFFQALARKELDWSRVTVLLADERWVPESDEASNTALVKRHLLQHHASAARYLSLTEPGEGLDQALPVIEQRLERLALPLDVLVLGMGNDGHTASLFPTAQELPHALSPPANQRVMAMRPSGQPYERITLTLPVLQNAGYTALLVKGPDKLATLEQAARACDQVAAMPVRAFIKPGLKVYWSP